jgi:Rrf2 family nitric oxide-sensitive transcriptional repressor
MFKLQTDYALRTLIYLAHVDGQASVQEIATAYGISRDHLFKVVQQLVRLGLVVSRPGRNGGVRLGREASQINCGEVVAGFEGRHGLLPCVKDQSYCVLEPGCALRTTLIKAEQAMFEVLERLTIADILRNNATEKSGGVYNLTIRRRPFVGASANINGAEVEDANGNGDALRLPTTVGAGMSLIHNPAARAV